MTNREAINWLTRIRDRLMTTSSKQFESMTIAIAALEQQEKAEDEWCPGCKEYDHDHHCCHPIEDGDEEAPVAWMPLPDPYKGEKQDG